MLCQKMLPAARSVSRRAALAARVVNTLPLVYCDGPDAALDRPAHVRAGSSLALLGGRLAVVQDDANFLAVVEAGTWRVSAIPLPCDSNGKRLFDDTRGTKGCKMDLEAMVPLDRDRVLLFGSGSTAKRERVALVHIGGHTPVRVVDMHALYQALRDTTTFSGSELNIEGVALLDHVVRFFNRKNGAPRNDQVPVNASCDVDRAAFFAYLEGTRSDPPPLHNVVRYELGQLRGVDLGFTDATFVEARVFFSASAENSPDAVQDGEVTGSAVGMLTPTGGSWIEVTDATTGAPYPGKIEGLVVLPNLKDAFAIVDCDSPNVPSELLTLRLDGPWADQ